MLMGPKSHLPFVITHRRSQERVRVVGLARGLLQEDEVLQVLLDALLLLL